MKTILMLLMTALIVTSIQAGDNLKEVKRIVGNDAILKNWKVGETKTVNDISIRRLSGENRIEGRTNLLFASTDTVIDGAHISAQCLYLFFDRESEEAADGKWISVSISNSGKPIWEWQTPSHMPRAYRYGIWYNFLVIPIGENLPEDFLVTVKDGFDGNVYEFAVAQPVVDGNDRISAEK